MPTHFACDMSAIPSEKREAHHQSIRRPMTEAVEENEVEAEGGPLLLRLTGAEGVKDFIRAELQLPADPGLEW